MARLPTSRAIHLKGFRPDGHPPLQLASTRGSEGPSRKGVLPGTGIGARHLAHAHQSCEGPGLRGDLPAVVPDPLATALDKSEEPWIDTPSHLGQILLSQRGQTFMLGCGGGCVTKFHDG